jgi:glycosyltransferase involved in cell wall biosynthesis
MLPQGQEARMKVAIVHDWLTVSGGAEKVLEHMLNCFPQADIFTIVDYLEDRSFLKGRPVSASFIQNLPFAKAHYRSYLPLMPIAIEQMDLSEYELVISSSYAVAKGVLTGPNQLHVSYIHSPMRYAWDLQHQYLKESGINSGLKSAIVRVLLHYVRGWDVRSTNAVDHLISNSQFVARRIRKFYGRSATVIYPPVDVSRFTLSLNKEDFYLTASRLVPYKRIDLIVKAFSEMPDKRLVVIGDGPEMRKIQALAGPNVQILGYQSFDVLRDHLRRARAFVFAAEEDFGISPVEAQACGTPVIAFGKGGALETVIGPPEERPTGVFFREQTESSLKDAVAYFEQNAHIFKPSACRQNAERFSAEQFRSSFETFVNMRLAQFRAELRNTATHAIETREHYPDPAVVQLFGEGA